MWTRGRDKKWRKYGNFLNEKYPERVKKAACKMKKLCGFECKQNEAKNWVYIAMNFEMTLLSCCSAFSFFFGGDQVGNEITICN